MSATRYYQVASTLFAIIAVAHGIRALYGWEATVAGYPVPVWFSWVAVALAGYLAYRGFSFLRKR